MTGVYTVSQINAYIKNMFTRDYALSSITIKGEVSNCKYHTTGHIYFTLKDAGAAIACVMFASQRAGLTFRMEDGQEIEAKGQISLYEKAGTYQLYVKSAVLSGRGALYECYLKLKNELQEMGMFDQSYKKPIPAYAKRIGIVTAPTGAAIRDICNISLRRNPYAELILYPALVQGERAKFDIKRGIEILDAMGLDVIIVGRGGGSIEDLWAFNEELVARAIFDAETPIISAVGHETDFCIADFAADLRAPTPSAAAELANFEYAVFAEEIAGRKEMLRRALFRKLDQKRAELRERVLRLEKEKPEAKLGLLRQMLTERGSRIETLFLRQLEEEKRLSEQNKAALCRLMQNKLQERKHRLSILAERLHGRSPLMKISGGYGYVTDGKGKAVQCIASLKEGDTLITYMRDGKVKSRVEQVDTEHFFEHRETEA